MSTNFKDDLSILQKEPALITGVLVAVIGLLGAFGLQINDNTQSAVTAVVVAVLALVGALVTRTQVTPAAVAQKQIDKAASDSAASGVPESLPAATEEGQSVDSVPDNESGVADSTSGVNDADKEAVEEALGNDEAEHADEVDESHLEDESEEVAPEATPVTDEVVAPEVEAQVVPEQTTDVVDSNVESESTESDEPLAEALKALDAATAAKESALSKTAKALEEVQAEAATAASTYATKIAEAQQKLAEVQAK